MSSLDYLDLCRLCLVKDGVSVPIFEGEGDVRQIFLKIAACLPVKVAREDKLPKKICDNCVYKVELLYQFWNTTANAEKQLLQWLGEVGLEDKQGYVTGVLNTSTMKEEDDASSVIQSSIATTTPQSGIGIGVIDNIGLGMPFSGTTHQQQLPPTIPINQPIHQALPGPSNQPAPDQLSQTQGNATTRPQDEEEESSEEEDNSDDDCDADDGLPVKEESEEDLGNSRNIEPTTFVNVSLACDEAGPSGLQQQKNTTEIPELSMPQTLNESDAKSGFMQLPLSEEYYRILMLSKLDLVKNKQSDEGAQKVGTADQTSSDVNHPIKEELKDDDDDEDDMPLAYHCKTCAVFFKTKDLLNNHEIEHKGKRKNTCNQCGRVFRTYINLRKHMKKHAGNKNKNEGRPVVNVDLNVKSEKSGYAEFACKTCNKVFRHKSNYQKHLLRHTAGDLTCNHCPKKFRLFRDLTRHEKTHFYPSYMCKECDYETTVVAALGIHMLRHTNKSDLPFKCNDCDKRFRKAIELQEHYNIHSGEKPCICTICGSAFHLRRQLSAHCRRTHPEMKASKVTSTACDICGRVLATKRSLFRHKESHNPTKLYLCDYCGKSLSSSEHLKKHRRIHTGEKPYVCDICGKGFTDSENLRMHRRIHTGEKPYKCDQCPKAFSQRSTLTIHRRGHTGERPYICQICHRGFSCQGNLTAHQKSTCV
ncbi:zinc finger protein 479-like isoform X4 [Athalia rosae]|uniref:zinc finger protein 479-like isoform X4 n=1 Tax=Athalia rosae TaxID=37344 RepID=UPI00203388BA|nr:zinc finger protein 479-like isoform X4 [Athalia rosae]